MGKGRYRVQLERSASLRLPVHPDSPATENWRAWALRQDAPRAVDLFCGCGGLSLGLERAGYRVVLSVDSDPWALETHRHNFPGPALGLDLSDPERTNSLIRLLKGVPLDLVAAGPPCQPFSRAGRSKIRSLVQQGSRPKSDHRRELWRAFLEVVCAVRPSAALMENVPDMALGDELATLRRMTAELERAGYEVYSALLDAWRYGVPQHRQRLILVAVRHGGSFSWPKETERLTLRDAIGDLPPLKGGPGQPEIPARTPRTTFQLRARRGMSIDVVWDHVTRAVRADDRQAFALMKPGTRYDELPERLRRYRSDIFTDKYNRLAWGSLCRSITAHIAKDGYWYIHPSQHRTLTVREAARVQTFPDVFRFAGSRSHAYQQIGNAVPPALAEAVAREVKRACEAESLPPVARQSHVVGEVRERLLKWIDKDAKKRPWLRSGRAWDVLVGALLAPRSERDEEFVRETLRVFPSPVHVTREKVRRLQASGSERMGKRLAQLSRAARKIAREPRDARSGAVWVETIGLQGRERDLVRALGLRKDVVLVTTQSLRVVGRLTGRSAVRGRGRSDGRMAIGVVVGSGRQVPALNGALTALGSSVCTSRAPLCDRCPVESFCASAGSQ